MRAYTLPEIDKMRKAVGQLWLFGPEPAVQVFRNNQSCQGGRSYRSGEKEKAVEEQLRTYMAADTDPEELHKHAFGDGKTKWVFEFYCHRCGAKMSHDDYNALHGCCAVHAKETKATPPAPSRGILVGGTMNYFYSEDKNGNMVEDFPPPRIAAKMGQTVDGRKDKQPPRRYTDELALMKLAIPVVIIATVVAAVIYELVTSQS